MSAPAATSSIPLLNPPEKLQKFVKEIKESTNPFLNGILNFENLKTTFFSATISPTSRKDEFQIENERGTKSASCNNPFLQNTDNDMGNAKNVFDFNPTTIKSILEENHDDGYDGDNDEEILKDPLKQLEERIMKLEASEKRKSMKEDCDKDKSEVLLQQNSFNSSRQQTSSDSLNHISNNSNSLDKEKLNNANVFDKYADLTFNRYKKHIRNRSFSENEASELGAFEYADQISPPTTIAPQVPTTSTNPFTVNQKRLHKTPSETYLEQYSLMQANSIVQSKPILTKHPSLTKILGSTHSIEAPDTPNNLNIIKRAVSCESVSSESSVVMVMNFFLIRFKGIFN